MPCSLSFASRNERCRCKEGKNPSDCSFCVYMLAGPCGSQFAKWQRCLERVSTTVTTAATSFITHRRLLTPAPCARRSIPTPRIW